LAAIPYFRLDSRQSCFILDTCTYAFQNHGNIPGKKRGGVPLGYNVWFNQSHSVDLNLMGGETHIPFQNPNILSLRVKSKAEREFNEKT